MLKQEKITADVLHKFIDVNEFTAALDSVMDGELLSVITIRTCYCWSYLLTYRKFSMLLNKY